MTAWIRSRQGTLRWTVLSLAGLTLGASEAVAELVEGLTFYAPFDGSAKPTLASGSPELVEGAQAFTAGAGREGRGFASSGQPMSWHAPANFDVARGTLAFWVKPQSPLAAPSDKGNQLFGVSATNFVIRTDREGARLLFMTGAELPGEGFRWHYGCNTSPELIAPGQWSHLAVTWDRDTQVKRIYVNGRPVASSTTPRMRDRGGEQLSLGRHPGLYDGLAIWNRVLNPQEIASLHASPGTLSAAASEAAKNAVAAGPAWTIKPGLVEVRPDLAIFDPGATVDLSLPVVNTTDAPQSATITATALDLWDRLSGPSWSKTVSLNPGEQTRLDLQFSPQAMGFHRVRVAVQSDGAAAETAPFRDVTSFAVLPSGEPPHHPFFGTHVVMTPGMPEAGRRLGNVENRIHNMTQFTWWTRMQPDPGAIAAYRLDRYRRYLDLGYTHYGQFFATPYWAARLGDGTTPPKAIGYPPGWLPHDREAYLDYLRFTLATYPEIVDWECWNEPYVSRFFYGGPLEYFDLLKQTHAVVKAERPDVRLWAQLPYEGPWLREVLRAGALDYADGIAIHGYTETDLSDDDYRRRVAALRASIAANTDHDPQTVPIIKSEGGLVAGECLEGLDFPHMPPIANRPPLKIEKAASAMVRQEVTLLADGVEKHHYYLLDAARKDRVGLREASWRMLEVTGTPRPAAVSRAVLVWQLDGGAFEGETHRNHDGRRALSAFLFSRDDGRTLGVLWSPPGITTTLELADVDVDVFDLMGNPLTAGPITATHTPIYLHADADSAALADAINAADLAVRRDASELGRALADRSADQPYQLAAELGRERLFPQDLSSVANMGLADETAGDGRGGWMDEGPFNEMRMLEPGEHDWLGIPFVIAQQPRSVLTLRGKAMPAGPASARVELATPDKPTEGLFFAHVLNWGDEPGLHVATIAVQYDDGRTLELPVVTGENIGNAWSPRGPSEASRVVALTHPDPTEPNKTQRFPRVWYWNNPRPNRTVIAVDVRTEPLSAQSPATYTLIAITAAVR